MKVNQFSLRVVVFGMSSYMARPKKNVKYEIVHTPSEPLIDATPNMHYILPLVKLSETMENKNQIFSFFTNNSLIEEEFCAPIFMNFVRSCTIINQVSQCAT